MKIVRFILTHSDAALALAASSIVAMMIIPLPTWLLDILIASNITVAVTLLLVVLYISEPLAVATFPTILLLTTLYRLALNVSSTRLILLQADAGHVINAFGTFVVSGNYIVGGVIFLILTIIQFVVIAKGSERVAEVAARFTLDAMPGKQMSIDADLRAGIIDSKDARRRRALLEREAQFYGAMDGGMRFVKGDAIAGICITVINIIAGLLIGIFQMGMSGREAAMTFSLLTVGDGLVSQIPALLISTSAGFVITRVASEEGRIHLGFDIGRQILNHPKALKIVAVLLIGLGIIPGLPPGPFLVLGTLTGFIGWSSEKFFRREPGRDDISFRKFIDEKVSTDKEADDKLAAGTGKGAHFLVRPISVEISVDISDEFGKMLQGRVGHLRTELFNELGIRLPPVTIRRFGDFPADYNFTVSVNEATALKGKIFTDMFFVPLAYDQLVEAGFKPKQAEHISVKLRGSWVWPDEKSRAVAYDVEVLKPVDYVTYCIEWVVKRHCDEIIGIGNIQEMVDAIEEFNPALVRRAIPKPVDMVLLTDISRRLVSEGISLRYMQQIIESLLTVIEHEKDPVVLTEIVRSSLKRYITSKYASFNGKLEAFVLSPSIEEAIRGSIHRSQAGSFISMPPEISKDITSAILKNTSPYIENNGREAVIVTHGDIRRFLKKLIEDDCPDVVVLSFQEISSEVTVMPVEEIQTGGKN